ncbi:MAG: hypothetical protein ACXV5P_09795 [Halobacteriota archaeon]
MAEEQALAEIRTQKLNAQRRVQQEKARAESELRRSYAGIFDWAAVRLAEAMMRYWDRRCARAEDALAQCKEQRKRLKHD